MYALNSFKFKKYWPHFMNSLKIDSSSLLLNEISEMVKSFRMLKTKVLVSSSKISEGIPYRSIIILVIKSLRENYLWVGPKITSFSLLLNWSKFYTLQLVRRPNSGILKSCCLKSLQSISSQSFWSPLSDFMLWGSKSSLTSWYKFQRVWRCYFLKSGLGWVCSIFYWEGEESHFIPDGSLFSTSIFYTGYFY